MSKEHGFEIIDDTIAQPVCHGKPDGGSFVQRVKLLVPSGVTDEPSVLFIMGNETSLSDKILAVSYHAYGERKDLVILCGEHRGYGSSITEGDQSLPVYVKIDEALADYHGIFLCYRDRFPGAWIIGGYSYGGSLAIAYAATYPGDGKAVLCSSGVVDWDVMIPSYDSAARENLGDRFYSRLCRHIDRLTPLEPFDANWHSREIVYAFVTGLSQRQAMNERFLGMMGALSLMPTTVFIGALCLLDRIFAGGEASAYAASNGTLSLSSAEAGSGRYNWRGWRYQQATETGTFWAPSGGESVYRRTADDWNRECTLLFDVEAPVFKGPTWNVRAMVPRLKIPLVYVRGGRDPWRDIGLEPGYPLKNGKVLSYDNGFHCPDRDTSAGLEVIDTLFTLINESRKGKKHG